MLQCVLCGLSWEMFWRIQVTILFDLVLVAFLLLSDC